MISSWLLSYSEKSALGEDLEPAAVETSANKVKVDEATEDVLAPQPNILHVTIGGQSVAIKTNAAAATTTSAQSSSPEGSEQSAGEGRESALCDLDEAVSDKQEIAEVVLPEVDLLADFSAPDSSVAPAPVTNGDIMDLLGGLESSVDILTAPADHSSTLSELSSVGGIGKLTVVCSESVVASCVGAF